MKSTRFTGGDSVRIVADAPPAYRPSNLGSICGMRTIDSKEIAAVLGSEIGTTFYIVEFGDGVSTEIPDQYIEGAQESI